MKIRFVFLAVAVLVSLISAPAASAVDATRTFKGTCEEQRKRNIGSSATDPAAREDATYAGYKNVSVRKAEYKRLRKTDTNKDGVVCEWPGILDSNNFPMGVPDNAALFATALLEDLRYRTGKDELCAAYKTESIRPALVESLTVGRETVGLDIGTASRIVDGSLRDICSYRGGPLTIITRNVDSSTVKFRSCTVMNTIHPTGLARNAAAADAAVVDGFLKPRVSRPLFRANPKLDRDKDGVICPARAPIPLPGGTPSATPTPAPSDSTPATPPASGDSSGCVTAAEFGSVREGMTVSQVESIFGATGTVTATSSAFDTTVELRDYPACTEFGAVSLVFTNGTLTSKAGIF